MITKSFTFAGLSLILLLASLSQAENNCAPLPPGLIAWWPGDGFALDVVSTNDGALRNGATFAPGKVGQAFRFDGVDDLVEIPNVAALGFAPGTSGTLEFWLYRTKASLPIHFLGKRSGCYDNAGINYQSAIDYNNPPFPLNTWIHWVQVYRPDGVYIYTNGILYGYSPGATFGSKNSATLRIGTSDDCPGQGFGGLIDEVSIYNRALSAGEISGIYSAGDAGKCYSNNPAPAFLRQPTTQTQYAGMSMGLDGFAMGNPRPVFQWLKDGVPIPQSTNPILNFASLDSTNSGAYALMASNIYGVVTSAPAILTILTPPFVTTSQEGFEQGWAGWTTDNPAVWELGVPTSGPGKAHAGANCAATVLGGNYWDETSGRLVSPAFVVPSADQAPRLRFWHWYEFNEDYGPDFGEVQIRAGTNGWRALAHYENSSSGVWSRPGFDLSSYAGQTVQLGFYFESHAAYGVGRVARGWYVDEVALVAGAIQTLTANVPESFEGGLGDWCVDQGTWEVGVPATGPSTNALGRRAHAGTNCAATVLGGNYAYTDSRLISPVFGVPEAEQVPRLRYWQWYDVGGDTAQVEVRVAGTSNWVALSAEQANSSGVWSSSEVDLRAYAGQSVQVAFRLSGGGGRAGWYVDEVTVVTGTPQPPLPNVAESFEQGLGDWVVQGGTWEVGKPTGSAHAGANCAATVLGGNYWDETSGRLVSPAFVVPSADQAPRLRFWHWYEFNEDYGPDFGEVQIRAGTNGWRALAHYENSSSGVWSRPGFDLSSYAGQTVQLGFYFESHAAYGVGRVARGWYVDEVELRSGPEILPNPESFELGWGDWFSDSYFWQVRKPGNGPITAHTGMNAACGNTGGNYSASSSGRLISPILNVPQVAPGSFVLLNSWQWYQYGTGDAGLVQVSRWNGLAWDDWVTVQTNAPSGSSGGWRQAPPIDLTAYQGQEVRLAFYHTANSDGSVGAGWFIDDLSFTSFVPAPLALGQASTNQFAANFERQYFVFDVPSGGHLRLRLSDLDHLGANEVYLRRGSLPSAGVYDARFGTNGGASQSVLAADAGAGKWYALVYNASGPLPGDFALQADFFTGVALESVTPSTLGNSVPGTLDIRGAGFTPSCPVALVNGGTVFDSTDLGVISGSQMLADFDFNVMPAGNYSLRVTSGTNSSDLPFVITGGGQPGLSTKIIVPRQVGYHAVATVFVEYSNTGQVATLAPILEVSAQQNGRRAAILTLDESRLVEGFWTAAMPDGFANSVQFLASGKTPGILQPGESGRVPVYYAGWQQPWDFGYSAIYWNLSVLTADTTNLIDWAALQEFMRPSSYSAEQWDPVFGSLMTHIGFTWGDYVRALASNARYLAKLGVNVSDIRDLLSFEVMQASGLGITRTLASALDAQVQAPGLSIAFTRSFSADIPSHFRLGRFGRGWSDNWEYSLATASDGTVTVFGPSGSCRIFQPDSRGANYFSQPGDYAALRSIGANMFALQEAGGTLYTFSEGKLQSVQDPHTNRITCIYSGDQLTKLTHSAGPWLELTYTGARVTAMHDSVGRETAFAYDGSGEHLQLATDYRGLATSYDYVLTAHSPSQHALAGIGKPDGTHQVYTYDALGRLASKSGCCGSDGLTTYAYDSAGKVTATDCLTNVSTYWLDHRGTLVKSRDPLGNVTLRTFDAHGQLVKVTDPAGRIRAYDYDDGGNLATETDALGYSTRYSYDGPFSRLSTVLDANGNLTRYNYEPDGDLASIVNAANLAEGWTYDAQGNRRTWQNRRSQTINYTNDSLGRVIARRYPDGTLHTFAYDSRGNLTNYTDAIGSTAQQFDAQDRLIQITYPAGYWLRYTYDTAGRRASMTDHLGHRTDYHYGADGRLQSLTDETTREIVGYEYDLAGRMNRKTLGNGVYTTYAYDAAGQLLDLFNHQTNGAVLSRFQYTYDNRGRRVTMTTTYGAGDPRTSLAGLWRYDYDDTGQLICWTAPWGRRVDYRYDGLGNRLLVRDNGTNIAYTVNSLNQYTHVGSTTYQYDADGNLTTKNTTEGATAFSWTTDNRLAQASRKGENWQNIYNATGNRVRSGTDISVRIFVIDPSGLGNIAGEFDSGGSLLARYLNGVGVVSRDWTDGSAASFTFDALGNTSELVSNSGNIMSALSYSPFGELLTDTQTSEAEFQFVGKFGVASDFDGLHNMRMRFYSADLGRFVSLDPIKNRGGLNQYRYGNNNPVSLIDPLGLLAREYDPNTNWPEWMYDQNRNPYWPYSPPNYGYRDLYPGDNRPFWDKVKDIWDFVSPFLDIPNIIGVPLDIILNPDPIGPGDELPPDKRWQPPPAPPGYQPPEIPDPIRNPEKWPTQPSRPTDPNELLGPGGYGPQNFVAAKGLLPYRINFENYSNATAPAQFVYITNQLSTNMDLTALELTSIGFGDRFFAIPPGSQHYERTEHVAFNGFKFDVQIEAGLNPSTSTVYARFQSLNPTNGLPPPVEIGFLPPENGTGRGMGHLAYVLRSKPGLATGTEIRNIAEIKFDLNPPLRTDLIDPHHPEQGIDTNKQALVTIDAELPGSSVTGLPATTSNFNFVVCWSGNDAGSGVAGYDIYVSTNSGPWGLWLANTGQTCATFDGRNHESYAFFSAAIDGAGNREPVRGAPDTQTTLIFYNTVPVLPAQTNLTMIEHTQMVVTNTAADSDTLSYQLLDPPMGMEIDTNGVITWIPNEIQGPSINVITTVVTDNGLPPLSATNSFAVMVTEVNAAPVLAVPTDQTLDELTALSISATANDPDLPANTLAFDIVSGPEGVVLDPATGVLTWTPSEAQGPGTNVITIQVTDSGMPALSVTNSFAVVVTEINAAPVLSVPEDQSLAELTTLMLTNRASDVDLPASGLTYQLLIAPAGAVISSTGVITWTPSEAQGPSTNEFVTWVADDGVPALSATNSFTVVVTEVNAAPVLAVPADQTLDELMALSISATASDPDLPVNKLSFGLVGGPPGLTVDSGTGLIAWTPSETQGPSTNLITIRVSDDGVPSLSVTQSLSVVVREVNSAPVLPVQTNLVVDELTELVVTNTATDGDLPANGLTYQLLSAPTGAVISAQGLIRWAPNEEQGPSTNEFVTWVADDGVPALSATNSFTVVVTEVNAAPVLTVPADQVMDELTLLSVSASVTDVDLPANKLVFGLVSGPAGLTVDSGTGLITWTPTEDQGPSTNVVTVRVNDAGVPPLSATNTFTVLVREVNRAPVLPVQTNLVVAELTELVVTNTAIDLDLPANGLAYQLLAAPAGAAISAIGVITWTPTEAQGPSTNEFVTWVVDDGVPALSATNSFTVVVTEVNTAPVLAVPADQVLDELTLLSVSASATDPDLPANKLVFGLVSGPAGLTVDSGTGLITWTPGEVQGPGTNLVTICVGDNGQPSLSVTQSFTVVVREANSAPIMPAQTNLVVAELAELVVTNTAADSDLPANGLTYQLLIAPAGFWRQVISC